MGFLEDARKIKVPRGHFTDNPAITICKLPLPLKIHPMFFDILFTGISKSGSSVIYSLRTRKCATKKFRDRPSVNRDADYWNRISKR